MKEYVYSPRALILGTLIGCLAGFVTALILISPAKANDSCDHLKNRDGDGTNNEYYADPNWKDIYNGHGGNDLIRGADCGDELRGGEQGDNIHAAHGNDLAVGGEGHDSPDACWEGGRICGEILGGDGHDDLQGNEGQDHLSDNVSGRLHQDQLYGGGDSDRVDTQDDDGLDRADGGSGSDNCITDSGDNREDCER